MTLTSSKQRNHSFFKGLLTYFIVALIIIAIGLTLFYVWISQYEKSRATYTISNYSQNITKEHVKTISADLLSEIDNELQSEEESTNLIYDIIKDSSPVKDAVSSTNDSQVYLLKSGDKYVEKVTLSPGSKSKMGFTPWEISSEEIIKESILSDASINVADTWTVKFNGTTVSDKHISDSFTEYSLLDGFYDMGYDLPVMVTYTSGGTIGQNEFVAVSPEGNEVSSDLLTEQYFTDNCTENEKSKLESFCKDYISRYVSYTSSGVTYGTESFTHLLEIVDRDSKLYEQLRGSLQGFGYASSNGDVIKDIRVLDYMNIGNDSYVCKVEYDLETYGRHNEITDQTFDMRLMIKEIDGELKAEAYLNY